MNNTPTTATNTTEKETTMDTTREIIDTYTIREIIDTYTDKIIDAQAEAAEHLRDFHERFMTTEPSHQDIADAAIIRDRIIDNNSSSVYTLIREMKWFLSQAGLNDEACEKASLQLKKFAAL